METESKILAREKTSELGKLRGVNKPTYPLCIG
jgi:hypothetical protein